MLFRTHLAFGVLAALVVMPFVTVGNVYIWFSLFLLGSLLPDVDCPQSKLGRKFGVVSRLFGFLFGHRGLFHSIWFCLLIPGLVWFFISKVYGSALFFGYFSHLLIDGLTKQGINYLHPVAVLRTQGFVETGTISEHIVLGVILVLIVVVVV